MAFSLIDKDWKKQAAMTATSDADIEKAFADQATGYIENKLPTLMRDGHNIGFEIVKKNDENTKMLGVFAFKVGKTLLFAPVFFLNGQIKGPLLYRTDTKTFVPANKEWATYLTSTIQSDDGKGVTKDYRRHTAPLVQMARINMAPGMSKSSNTVVKVPADAPTDYVKMPHGPCKVVFNTILSYANAADANKRLPGGGSLLKMSAMDDGTISCGFEGEEPFSLLQKDAALFKGDAADVAIETPDGKFVHIPAEGVKLIKSAFFDDVKGNAIQWDSFMKAAEWPEKHDGIIHEMLEEPDFGREAAKALIKAASSSYEFAEKLASIYGTPENLFPETYNVTPKDETVKDAVFVVNDIGELSKVASTIPSEYFRDGFFMVDSRPVSERSVVVTETPSQLTSIAEPGMYAILKNDGSYLDDAVVLPYKEIPKALDNDNTLYEDEYATTIFDNRGSARPLKNLSAPRLVVMKDGMVSCVKHMLYGIRTGDVPDNDGVSAPKEKAAYMLVVNGAAYGPVVIYKDTVRDGVHHMEVEMRNSPDRRGIWTDGYPDETWTYNPDLKKSDLTRKALGADAQLLQLRLEKPTDDRRSRSDNYFQLPCPEEKYGEFGDAGSLNQLIFNTWKLPHYKVTRREGNGTYTVETLDGDVANFTTKKAAMASMAVNLAMGTDAVYKVMDEVEKNGVSEFTLQPIEKVASRLRLSEQPLFTNEYDADFGVPVKPVETFILNTQADQMFEPPAAIGDMMNPTSPTGLPNSTVVDVDPEDLRNLADTYKLPNVFEHSVVGTLANAFNATPLVEKYVEKIEDGVDALGRIKFLIHWMPNDFENAYGVDDMINLESQIDANFNSLGSILLTLLKKTESYRKSEGMVDKNDDRDHE